MITAHMDVTSGGKSLGGMYPARWFFRNHEDQPTTEVALRRSVSNDLYLVLDGYTVETQQALISVMVNPLVNWIWLGVGILIIGTGIALLPERAFAFATAKVPAGAVTTSLLILMLTAGAISVSAQHIVPSQTVAIVPRTSLEKALQGEIICMCGTCGRKRIGECTCELAAEMRDEVAKLVSAGKTHEEVIQHFIAKYGSQEVLAQPIDKGFNRLAWSVPYAVGVAGVVMIAGVAVRWSRRRRLSATAPGAAAHPIDQALQDRLDDELRDLD
jgi:cytochrome c-type biogenesis protein CcmF